ncbi:hypothetical protein PoB_000804600 [Plakobranchus ocellatus]|uniref:Uncharacterized protein n=1 Tax=Plakobranchus ocellatus TaxID=259542 RepID=A0AAV3YEC7_9GAST|nr:hypothetical protein PoB_000804600 [Plakobranchus ocellatus]
MVSDGCLGMKKKTPDIHFLDTNETKVNSKVHVNLLEGNFRQTSREHTMVDKKNPQKNNSNEKIQECWDQIAIQKIRKSITSWKKRLMVDQDGGPIDHKQI